MKQLSPEWSHISRGTVRERREGACVCFCPGYTEGPFKGTFSVNSPLNSERKKETGL